MFPPYVSSRRYLFFNLMAALLTVLPTRSNLSATDGRYRK